MHCYQKYLLSLLLFLGLGGSSVYGQIFLQLERYNNPKSIKFYEGDIIEFRLKEYPDTWKKFEILDLKADEQVVVLEDQFYTVSAFQDVRMRHPVVKNLGKRLMQFGAVWFAYGGIASLVDDDFSIGTNEIVLGGVVSLAGLLMNKVFDKRKIRLSKKKRLRVMDLRFSINGS